MTQEEKELVTMINQAFDKSLELNKSLLRTSLTFLVGWGITLGALIYLIIAHL